MRVSQHCYEDKVIHLPCCMSCLVVYSVIQVVLSDTWHCNVYILQVVHRPNLPCLITDLEGLPAHQSLRATEKGGNDSQHSGKEGQERRAQALKRAVRGSTPTTRVVILLQCLRLFVQNQPEPAIMSRYDNDRQFNNHVSATLRQVCVNCTAPAKYPKYLPNIAMLFTQTLQVLEQLCKAGDALLESGSKLLPTSSPTALFLKSLGQQISSGTRPGQIIR